MISLSYVCTMASYNSEMNRRIFEAAGRLSDEERRAERGVFWRSIHGTLSHILWADQMQMSRFAQWPKPVAPIEASGGDGVSFEALWQERETFDHALLEWAAGLAPQWLDGEIAWRSIAKGRDVTSSKALLVVHMFNHQTHHRGQVHALITRAGESTGDTDLWLIVTRPDLNSKNGTQSVPAGP